jgi:hypothetical protein
MRKLFLALSLITSIGVAQTGHAPVPANLGATFKRGIFFRNTFEKSPFKVRDDKGHPLAESVVCDQVAREDLTNRIYIVVPFNKVYKAFDQAITPDQFCNAAIWKVYSLKSTGEEAELGCVPVADLEKHEPDEDVDPKFALLFGSTNVQTLESQLYCYIRLNSAAIPSKATDFKVSIEYGGNSFVQKVKFDGSAKRPVFDPLSAQHKTDAEVLDSDAPQELDQFKIGLDLPLTNTLALTGLEVLSTRSLDTLSRVELNARYVLPNASHSGRSFNPLSLVLGFASNQAFTHQIASAGVDVRLHYRGILKLFKDKDDVKALYEPPFDQNGYTDVPWFGIGVFGSHVLRADTRVLPEGRSRNFTYAKAQFALPVEDILATDGWVRHGLGLDVGGKLWWFIDGKESAGENVRTLESYMHAFVTVKFGSQKVYAGYEAGTNEASGFKRTSGWTVGIDLRF